MHKQIHTLVKFIASNLMNNINAYCIHWFECQQWINKCLYCMPLPHHNRMKSWWQQQQHKNRKKRIHRTALFQRCDKTNVYFFNISPTYWTHWFHLVFEPSIQTLNLQKNEVVKCHIRKKAETKSRQDDLLWKKINGKMVFAYAHCTLHTAQCTYMHIVMNYINAFWCKWTFFSRKQQA